MSGQVPAPWTGAQGVPGYGPGTAPSGYPMPPQQEGIDLRRIWGIFRRYWMLIVLVTGLAGAGGWFLTDYLTPIYEARATLRINDRESGVAGLDMLNELRGQGSEVNTELQVLQSRQLAQSITEQLALRVTVREPRRMPRSTLFSHVAVDPAVDSSSITITITDDRVTATDGRRQVTGHVGDTLQLHGIRFALTGAAIRQPVIRLSVRPLTAATTATIDALHVDRPSRDANILAIRFQHSDPHVAEQVPNLLLETFLLRRAGTRRTGATSTVAFLGAQLDTLSEELRLAEDSLRIFREKNEVVALQDQASVSVGKLAELQAERDAASSELAAVDTLMNRVVGAAGTPAGSFRRLLAFPTLLRNNTASTLLTTLTTLETERGRLLATRTMKDPDVMALTEQITGLETQVRTLVSTYADGLRQQVAAFDRTLVQSGRALNSIPAKEVSLARLMRNTSVLSELSTLLQTKLKEAQIAQAVDDPSALIVDHAAFPEHPVSPRRLVNVGIALILGLMLGLGAVFVRELFDTRIHSREDLQRMAPVPVLGVIPHFRPDRAAIGGRRRAAAPSPEGGAIAATSLVALANPGGVVLEAYRALRTNLAFALAEQPPKVVVVTSPTPGDGKSTTTANLAASLAQQKLRVLVIDADMRRGALHRTLGGVRGPGLSELLTGRADVAGVLQSLSFGAIGRIDLISTGTVPPNPAELLASPRLIDLLEALEPQYDTILIDSPPVTNVSDAMILAPHADGLLLVARGNKTERGAVRFAMEQLGTVRAKVMGTILNDFDIGRAEAYGGYYRYYGGAGYSSVSESQDNDAA